MNSPRRTRRNGSAGIAIAFVVAAWSMATACSGSSGGTPAGQGNDVIDDTRDASPRPPANPDPGDDAGEAGMTNPPIYTEAGTKYPGVSQCGDCTCGADKNFCFGGATPQASIRFPLASDGGGGGGDGGLPACVVIDAGAPELGCNPLPAGTSDCASLLAKLQASYSCYLVCASDGPGTPMTVYCPNG